MIISPPIFKSPYSFGYPFVEDTTIFVSEEVISLERVVFPTTTSGIKLSNFKYLSRLLIKSSGDEIYGFLLALNPALDYESINYKWFQSRYDQFAYIDRVAILKKYKRNGLGKKLYLDLEQTIKDNYKMIACEYNLKPMNLESEKFHLAIDYERVGSLVTENGAKEVSLMVKNI